MSKRRHYEEAFRQIRSVLAEQADPVAWMATISSILAGRLGFFWVGFYRVADGRLLIGPYQGTPGCLEIRFDQGVCGACASRGETIIVDDVHEFPGHIACDSRSNSEIVVPVLDAEGELRAVLDVDSTEPAAFDKDDREGLERIVDLMRGLAWNRRS